MDDRLKQAEIAISTDQASCGWTWPSAAVAVPSSASSGRVLKWYRIFIDLSLCRSLPLQARWGLFQFYWNLRLINGVVVITSCSGSAQFHRLITRSLATRRSLSQ